MSIFTYIISTAVYLEMNHGGMLCEKNILERKGFRNASRGVAFAHNLVIDALPEFKAQPQRTSSYYTPHTRNVAGSMAGGNGDDKWYNNIFTFLNLNEEVV